ncbi:hypothetical protein BH11MYX1_BH11MYX1_22780 [soil metagenome]
MRAWFFAGMLAGCTIEHHVTFQLGPDAETVTTGFTCNDPANPSKLLFARAVVGSTLTFNLVVAVIDVGNHVPACLAEDVVASCADGLCHVSLADAPTRFCGTIELSAIGDAGSVPAQVTRYLRDNFPTVITEAPHHPVIVRAVATTQPCNEIEVANGDDWTAVDRAAVLGCAYSCPIDLDNADGIVELGINVDLRNATAAQCQATVDACAVFPATS